MNKIHNKALSYIIIAIALTGSYIFLWGSSWNGSSQLHTLMEALSTLLALMVGSMALVSYYNKKDDCFLIIGTGLIATGILDACHNLITSIWFAGYLTSDLPSLLTLSWTVSRLFVAAVFYFSCHVLDKEKTSGQQNNLNPKSVYYFTAFLTLTILTCFTFCPIPLAPFSDFPIHRPQELIATLFFVMALVCYPEFVY